MQQFQLRTSHRPRPLPSGRWAMTQRWNDLLFAHWPIPVAQMAALLPDWLEVDTFQGSAWLGIVPFWLDRIKIRGVPSDSWSAQLPRPESAHLCPRPVHRHSGRLLLFAGCQQPAGCGRGSLLLSPAVLLV